MSPAAQAVGWGYQGMALMFVVLALIMSFAVFHYHMAESLVPHQLRIFAGVVVALTLLCLALSWAGASRMFF